MKRLIPILFIFSALLIVSPTSADSTTAEPVGPTIAVLPFAELGDDARDLGAQASDLLSASLSASHRLEMVERAQLDKVFSELALGAAGFADPAEAVRVGRLVGARGLVTGSVVAGDGELHLVAKLVAVESGRSWATSVEGSSTDTIAVLARRLAEDLLILVDQRSDELKTTTKVDEDPLAAIQVLLGDAKRPMIAIEVSERFVGRPGNDMTARTELQWGFSRLGFGVFDSRFSKRAEVEVVVSGNGLAELAGRRGDLVSVTAHLQLQAVSVATGRILASDRQIAHAVGASEQIAARSAMTEATQMLLARLAPSLLER